MKRNLEIVDEYLYTLELEQPKTRILKNEVKPKRVETPQKEIKPFKKPLEVNPIYRYTKDGDFVDKYLNASQMAKKLGWREKLLKQAADQERLYNGFLLTHTTHTKEQIQERFRKPKKQPREKKPNTPRERKPKAVKEKQPYVQINPIYRYSKVGDFIDKFLNANQMGKKLSWKPNRINKAADQERLYNGFFLSRTNYTKEQLKERLTPQKKPKVVKPIKEKKPYIQLHPIYQYKEDGELVATYSNGGEMSKVTGWNHNTVKVFSTKERVFNGFLITRTSYTKEQAKQRFTEALKRQQMTYVYKDGELIATLSSLTQVKELIKSTETLRRITYLKQIHKPIEGYVLSSKPLESKENT